jgi:hypothetical protein
MEDQALPMVLTLKSGFSLFLKDDKGVTREVASIFPTKGMWVVQYYSSAELDSPFRTPDCKGE